MVRLYLPLLAAMATSVAWGVDVPTSPNALDLLNTTPNMMGAIGSMNRNSITSGNTMTITDSKIMFARADRQTMVNTVRSMILNSEPKTGDTSVTNAILSVLNAGANKTKILRSHIAMALECRDHKGPTSMLEKCIESMVDVAMANDNDEGLERRKKRKSKKSTPESDSESAN